MVETTAAKGQMVEKTKAKPDPAKIREKVTLSPEEAAWILGYGLTRTYALLRDGSIPSRKNGRFWLVQREDVDAHISERLAENSR